MTVTTLVTGGGSGIGRACALTLAENGHHVIVTGRRMDALEETVSLIGTENASAISADLTNPEQVDALYNKIEADHGHLDVLFNNAGNNVPARPIGDIPVEDFIKVIDVNVTGAFLAARGAFNLMRQQNPQGGRIINNGSISATMPRPGSTPYTCAKHAITGLTRTIALDGRPYNIACGQIDIGNAASNMTSSMGDGVPQADLSIKPEPVMDVQNVAKSVFHMASLPLDANVLFMTVMATSMPFVGRG